MQRVLASALHSSRIATLPNTLENKWREILKSQARENIKKQGKMRNKPCNPTWAISWQLTPLSPFVPCKSAIPTCPARPQHHFIIFHTHQPILNLLHLSRPWFQVSTSRTYFQLQSDPILHPPPTSSLVVN